ncbi:MAG: glycosyltransferase [Hyphomonadaceae bacterium]|nr:glycosyltransferase [Hyphomonadaceae bacterium]
MNATVAVIIAAYNAEATLERAIDSALAQPETAQVCVVDDGSRDGTLAVARAAALRDARVLALTQVNAGPAAARNAAIAATTAPWIAILDSDDYMLPGRLATLMAAAEGADFVADALMRVREEDPAPALNGTGFTPTTLDFENFVRGNMSVAHGLDLGFLKPVMRRGFLETHALTYRGLRLGEDYDFYCRALLHGARFLVGGSAGYISIDRPGSLSNDHTAEDLRQMRDCDSAYPAIRPLTKRERDVLRQHWARVDCRLQWRLLIDAVKRRDAMAAISTFHSPPAARYLAARLGEQLWQRGPLRVWLTVASMFSQGEAPPGVVA